MSEEILGFEPDEGLEKIANALKIMNLYRKTFNEKKNGLASYFKDSPVVEWDFPPEFVFSRIDSLVARLKMIMVSSSVYHTCIINYDSLKSAFSVCVSSSGDVLSCISVLQTYFQTVNEFLRLEKIVFGDIRGEVLTQLVAGMYTEFNDLLSAFQGKGGDPLNLTTTVSTLTLSLYTCNTEYLYNKNPITQELIGKNCLSFCRIL